MKTRFELGTVSHATLRPQDLVPAFLERLHSLEPETHASLLANFRCVALSDDDSWWESEDCAHFLNEDLFDALNNCAPDYVYFGSHEGDGADFGFWICWDHIGEDIESGELIESISILDLPDDHTGNWLNVKNKHSVLNGGTVSLMNRNAHKKWESKTIWTVV